jgi:hypothetical protein
MASNIDRKYRSAGWTSDKDIKTRTSTKFEKDMISNKSLTKKSEKIIKKELQKYKVEYCFPPRIGKSNIEYRTLIVEGYSKEDAKINFNKWDTARKRKIEDEMYSKLSEDERKKRFNIFKLFDNPEYFAKINNINKIIEKTIDKK